MYCDNDHANYYIFNSSTVDWHIIHVIRHNRRDRLLHGLSKRWVREKLCYGLRLDNNLIDSVVNISVIRNNICSNIGINISDIVTGNIIRHVFRNVGGDITSNAEKHPLTITRARRRPDMPILVHS
jgi:hypothetical protein